jgi:hypothetical protein
LPTKITFTYNGVRVELPTENWQHIANKHKEMRGHSIQVLRTVSDPYGVYRDPLDPNKYKAYRYHEDLGINIMVVYEVQNGFILTAYRVDNLDMSVRDWIRVGGLER